MANNTNIFYDAEEPDNIFHNAEEHKEPSFSQNAKKNLEQRKELFKIAEQVPKKAYWISGHGSQSKTTWKVPDNCIIIVKTIPGISQDGIFFRKYYKTWCNLDPELVKNPLFHLSELRNPTVFQSIAIYKPGMLCPTFNYSIVDYYSKPKKYYPETSGILDFDHVHENKNSIKINTNSYNDKDNLTFVEKCDFVANQFINSTYPTKDEVESYLKTELLPIKNFFETSIDSINSLFGFIDMNFSITQEDLCKRFPGVYYNFVCRNIRNIDTNVQIRNNTNSYLERKIIVDPTKIVGSKNNSIKYLRNQILSETELLRKPAYRNIYLKNQTAKLIKGNNSLKNAKAGVMNQIKELKSLLNEFKQETPNALYTLNRDSKSYGLLNYNVNSQIPDSTQRLHKKLSQHIKKLENLHGRLKGGNYTKKRLV